MKWGMLVVSAVLLALSAVWCGELEEIRRKAMEIRQRQMQEVQWWLPNRILSVLICLILKPFFCQMDKRSDRLPRAAEEKKSSSLLSFFLPYLLSHSLFVLSFPQVRADDSAVGGWTRCRQS
jgi:hypothetical protein